MQRWSFLETARCSAGACLKQRAKSLELPCSSMLKLPRTARWSFHDAALKLPQILKIEVKIPGTAFVVSFIIKVQSRPLPFRSVQSVENRRKKKNTRTRRGVSRGSIVTHVTRASSNLTVSMHPQRVHGRSRISAVPFELEKSVLAFQGKFVAHLG